MNSNNFTDKQVMNSSKSNFYDTDDDDDDSGEVDPNEDHGFRGLGFRQNQASGYSNSRDFGIWNQSSVSHIRSTEAFEPKSGVSSRAMLVSRIGKTMKDHIRDLLPAIEGVSSHITQLESKTRHLEHTVDDLKGTVEFLYAETEGKMKNLENILEEVHVGIQFLKDKQEIAETQMLIQGIQLSRSKASKPPSENRNNDVQRTSGLHTSSIASAPPQAISSIPLSASSSLSHAHQPTLPFHLPSPPQGMMPMLPKVQIPPMVHSRHNLQNLHHQDYMTMTSLPFDGSPSHPNLPPQPPPAPLISPQGAAHIAPGAQSSSTTHPVQGNIQHIQFLDSVNQQNLFPAPSRTQQLSSILPHEPFPFAAHAPQDVPSYARYQSPSSHQLVEVPYVPSNSFPSNVPQSPRGSKMETSLEQLHSGPFQSVIRSYAEAPEWRSFSRSNDTSHDLHHYQENGDGSSRFSLKPKDSRHSSSPISPRKPLQYALPIVSASDHSTGSGVNENKFSGDDVIEKIVTMGFRRDLARDVVRKLKEGGQPVDLNAVLDKLMNHRGRPSSKG